MGIAEVSFFAGILLFFVAIIGGGIEIKELKIPQITGSAKYSCLAGSLMFIALGLYLKNVLPVVSTPTNPATAKIETKTVQTTVATSAPNQQLAVTTPTTTPSEQTAVTTPAIIPTQPTPANTSTPPVPITPPDTTAQPSSTQTATTETTATSVEKSILAKRYAQTQLDAANKSLNEVWNTAEQDIRNELLPKQRQWLKQREADCAAKAANQLDSDEVMKEALKIGCMAKLTEPRIEQLKQEITELEQSIVEEPEMPNPDSIAAINSSSIQDVNAKQQAKQQLDDANKRLNQVWNATTADIRQELLPEQREWLKQRENDCTAQAVNEDKELQDVLKLTCMANMTDPRAEELKQKIAAMSQQ